MTSDISLATSNPEYLSGSIKWSGLASGVDFGAVVDQLVEIENITINRLTLWKSTWEEKITSIQGLNSRMSSLGSFVEGFNSFSEFYSRSSASSDTSVVTTTNTSSASPGSHTIQVGEDISGRVASRSYDSTAAVGGAGGTLTIHVGGSTVTLVEGVDFNSTDTIDQLATKINTKDDGGSDILEDVAAVEDKTRSGNVYKRLIITAKTGGADNAVTVDDPTDLNMDTNSIDDPYYESNWLSDVDIESQGTYTGSTNKTFTFRITQSATLTGDPETSDSITVQWADSEGNSGSLTVESFDTYYEVFQGLEVRFADGGDDDNLYANDSFTVDVYNPTLQAAQDKGLAQMEQRVHEGFSDLITPITTSDDATFSYYYEGVQTTVSVAAGSKLQDLVDAINNDSGNRGVVASIINDGQNTSTSYHLVLTGGHTGAEHTITDITGTNLDNFDAGDSKFTTAQKATNSMLKVDGYPVEDWEYIQRSSNSVSDIVEGLTLNFHDSGSATVTVSNNMDAIKSNIELFVNSVNFVQDYIHQETKFDPETGESAIMQGNYTYNLVRSVINDVLYDSVTGLSPDTDTYVHLSQIGIKTDPDRNGLWVIEPSKLNEALDNDLEAVARLFVRDDDHGSLGICERLRLKLENLTDSEDGIANVLIDNYGGIIKDIDTKIAREERRVKMVKERLELKFARLETMLGELEGQSDYLESQLANLPGIGGD